MLSSHAYSIPQSFAAPDPGHWEDPPLEIREESFLPTDRDFVICHLLIVALSSVTLPTSAFPPLASAHGLYALRPCFSALQDGFIPCPMIFHSINKQTCYCLKVVMMSDASETVTGVDGRQALA